MNIQSFTFQRKVILIASGVGIISLFLPWFTVSASAFGFSQSVSMHGFRDSGVLVFFAFCCSIVMSLRGDQSNSFNQSGWWVCMISGCATLIGVLIALSGSSGQSLNMGYVDTNLGIGLFICAAASIAVIAITWLYKAANLAPMQHVGRDNSLSAVGHANERLPDKEAETVKGQAAITELQKLIDFKDRGYLSEEEFVKLKENLL